MKTAKFERCSRCGSSELQNIFYVESGEPPRVYVRCAKCGAFVARYTLSRYTSDQPYESLLRILRRYSLTDSRRSVAEIEAFTRGIEEKFREALRMAEEGGEKRRIEEIIDESED